MRVAPKIELTDEERVDLERFARGRSTPMRLVLRSKIVLRAANGEQNRDIATALRTTPRSVGLWRKRFVEKRLAGILKDAPGRGRPSRISARRIAGVVRKTLKEKPSGRTHWSTRTMAAAVGLSESTIRRIWRANGLKPHLTRTFKVSNDKHFVEKLEDVVGLYLSPPEHAVVFSVDEKSQIQALDRTQPGLPLKKGRAGTFTHDYKRNGTTTLFAALNVLDGNVIGTCMQRHRHQEWIRFLELIDSSVEPDKDIHLIADNYATHKHARVQRWLKRHPRFHMHFTPTSSSWLNMVERFFRDITENAIRRGVFPGVDDLIKAIDAYLAQHNANPKPFVWTASANDILEKVKRARSKLDQVKRAGA
jgi:transposase